MSKGSICFLSMDSLSKFDVLEGDDAHAEKELRSRGYSVETISWKAKGVDWSRFDLVVIRSTWDYQYDVESFINTLKDIAKKTNLENSADLVRYNSTKAYLKDFAGKGVKTVPTFWFDRPPSYKDLMALFTSFGVPKMVIKPQIGAGSESTYVLEPTLDTSRWSEITKEYLERPSTAGMVQPFRTTIQTEGEYSTVYFGDRYSHMIIKKPKKGDFRVQQTYGSHIVAVTDVKLVAEVKLQADKVHAMIPRNKDGKLPLYSRVDLLRNNDNEFELMELEVIEPMLYFRNAPESSPKIFADVIVDYLRKK